MKLHYWIDRHGQHHWTKKPPSGSDYFGYTAPYLKAPENNKTVICKIRDIVVRKWGIYQGVIPFRRS